MELVASVLWSTDVLVGLVLVMAAPLLYNLWSAFLKLYWRPLRIKRAFEAQGIPALPFHFLYGNLPEFAAIGREARRHPMPQVSHDIAPRILPHYYQWPQKYGVPYVYWFGSEARYNLINAEDAKDILFTKFGHYPKPVRRADARYLLGNGLVSLEGEKWAQHRRIMNPAFFLDKLKAMIPTIEACTTSMIENWGSSIEAGQAIDVQKSLKDLTADIISHTAFGSSFAEGKRVFELQTQQQVLMDKLLGTVYIPGARFLPTASNRLAWKIDRDIRKALRQVIKSREESIKIGGGDSYGNDLLGIMMAANKHELQGNRKNLTMNIDDIIDECKTFYFAGHETTATLLTWTFLLLAMNPEWQTRMREEVLAVCGKTDLPLTDTINNLKIASGAMYIVFIMLLITYPSTSLEFGKCLQYFKREVGCFPHLDGISCNIACIHSQMGMVLNEVLRLYPPAILVIRQAGRDMQLGKVVIPEGTVVMVPIIAWHHDERYWGADVNEFRPERFSEGVAKASKVAGAFMPFAMGPRVCIGQNFALLEAKVVLCTILRQFCFRLSPSYKHAPITVLTLQPQFGMPILFEKL